MIPLGILASARVASSSASLTHVASIASAAGSESSWTFSAVPLGDAVARTVLVAVGVALANGGTLSVTVAGQSAALDVVSPNQSQGAAIARLTLPGSTTTGDVVVSTGSINTGAWIHVYAIPGTVTVAGSDSQYVASGATSFSRTVDTAANGFALAVTGVRSNSAGAVHSWSGATENADLNHSAGTSSAASSATTGAQVTPACSLTGGSSLRFGCFAAAAYAPA